MISIEKSITNVDTLIITILIYKTLVLIPIFLSPSGAQNTNQYLKLEILLTDWLE